MKLQRKMLIKGIYDPSLKASRIRAYVEPILKLFIDLIINKNLEELDMRDDLIDISITTIIIIARNIVLTDLSNKKEIILLVR